jgi:glycosyltransferase involved in cell wall biosynthesis
MTVIIPAYNCSHVLPRALNSLVKQSDKDFSVVLVDDCSTEDLSIIVNQYKDKLNITHIYTSEN